MLPDRVSNPGPLTYESGALPIALRGPAFSREKFLPNFHPFLYSIHSIHLYFSSKQGEV